MSECKTIVTATYNSFALREKHIVSTKNIHKPFQTPLFIARSVYEIILHYFGSVFTMQE